MALSASDVQKLYTLLADSLSQDEQTRKTAEAALLECETRHGFCSCLLEIIASRDVSCREDTRLLASVYFKNCIIRFWRKWRNTLGISNEEKIHLRHKLLLILREENSQVALQLAVLISKIARIDYPKEWPELFASLIQQLHSADTLASHRIFLVLFRTLKELSTKRLTSDQKSFSEIASQLFGFTWNIWQRDVHSLLETYSTLSQDLPRNSLLDNRNDLFLLCERWLLCTKIIRELTVSGHPSDITTAMVVLPVKEVCPAFLKAIQSFLLHYASLIEGSSKLLDFTKRACIKMTKVLNSIQKKHPYSFGDSDILPIVLDFCLNNIINTEPMILSFEQFLIQCMVLMKSIFECAEYRPSLTGRIPGEDLVSLDQRKKDLSSAISSVISHVVPRERVILLCNVIVRRFFVFTAKDLDDWYQNSESFHHEQDMVQWTEKLRPCAEALYIVLFEKNRELLGPVVVSILREAMSGCPPREVELTPRMLLKDAAYTAVGHAYYELSSYLNFSEWFSGTLAVELSNVHPNMRIIHRKIAFILGQWASEIKGDTKKHVYNSLVRLLQDPDIAVRLAACRSLCYLVQDSLFSEQGFYEFLPTCWGLCFKLLDDAMEFDSKVQVLNLISVLMEHIGEKIVPYARQLSTFFQNMWEDSNGEILLRMQLLAALRSFVSSLGPESTICYDMLLPILLWVLDENNPDTYNLLEDSMLLWEATVSSSPMLHPQLFEIFPYLAAILESSFDHLKVAVNIIEDYLIFGGSVFMNKCAQHLAKVLYIIVGNVHDKGLLLVLPVIDILVQCFPMDAPPLIHGVLQKLIFICLTVDDEHNPAKTAIRTSSSAILARVLVMNTNYTAALVSEESLALALQQAGILLNQNVLLSLVNVWLDKMDNATNAQKKSFVLALCLVLTLRIPEVVEKLDEILSACTSVLLGGDPTAEEDSSGDSSSACSPNGEVLGHSELHSIEYRKRQIRSSDPLRQLSLEAMLRDSLKACAAVHGEASFNEAIARIHPSAFAQFQHAAKMI